MEQSQSFNEALTFAQDFAKDTGQNLIDIATLALGTLRAESPFSTLFSLDEREKMAGQLEEKTHELGTNELETGVVPMTMHAGLVIKFAQQYAQEVGDGVVDIYHIMLALLSYPNDVSTIFGRSGWIFENYLDAVNTVVSPPIEVGRLELDLEPSVREPYSKLRKKFWAEDYKNNIINNLISEANRHATFAKYETCIQLCNVVLDITPDDIDPYRLLIYCLCMEKRYQEAIDLYEEWGIDDETIRMNIGVCYRETGEHDKALEIFRSFEEMTAERYNAVGFSLNELGRYDDAIHEFDAAISANPNYAFAYNNKGYSLLKSDKIQEAKDAILHSLSLDMGNAFAYRNLALINIEEKDKNEAHANIDKALFYRYRERFGDDIDEIRERAEEI